MVLLQRKPVLKKSKGMPEKHARERKASTGHQGIFLYSCSLHNIYEDNTCDRLCSAISPRVSPQMLNKYHRKYVSCILNLISMDVIIIGLLTQCPTWRTRVFIFCGTYLYTPVVRETTNSYTATSMASNGYITHAPTHHSKILVCCSLK